MRVLAIDPGNIESGVVIADGDYKPLWFGKFYNKDLIGGQNILGNAIRTYHPDKVVIEMIAHYGTGMPAGKTVYDTCVAIGRFQQWLIDKWMDEQDIEFIKRKEYVTELCGTPKAKDSNVIQYLVDRFAPNTPNRGKGTKKEKGWFYGFHADVWQCYGLCVYYIDSCK